MKKRLTKEVNGYFETVDALLLPTVPGVPPKIEDADDPGYDNVGLTRPTNVTGHPAVTVPAGASEGLPVGMQLIAPRFDERQLLGIAADIQA